MIDKEMLKRLYIVLGLLLATLVLFGVYKAQKSNIKDKSGEDVVVLQPVEDFLQKFSDRNYEGCGLLAFESTESANYLNNKIYEATLDKVVNAIKTIEITQKKSTHYVVKFTIYTTNYTEPQGLVEEMQALNKQYIDEEIELAEYHVRFADLVVNKYKPSIKNNAETKEVEFTLRSTHDGRVLNKSEFIDTLLDETGVRENTLKFQELYNGNIDSVIDTVRKEAE